MPNGARMVQALKHAARAGEVGRSMIEFDAAWPLISTYLGL
jgi:hypothetical protein